MKNLFAETLWNKNSLPVSLKPLPNPGFQEGADESWLLTKSLKILTYSLSRIGTWGRKIMTYSVRHIGTQGVDKFEAFVINYYGH